MKVPIAREMRVPIAIMVVTGEMKVLIAVTRETKVPIAIVTAREMTILVVRGLVLVTGVKRRLSAIKKMRMIILTRVTLLIGVMLKRAPSNIADTLSAGSNWSRLALCVPRSIFLSTSNKNRVPAI